MSGRSLADILVASGRLSAADLERARAVQRSTGERLEQLLVNLGIISDRDRAEALARAHELPLVGAEELAAAGEDDALVELVSPNFLRQSLAMPLALESDRLRIAMADPADREAVEALELAAGRPVELCVAPQADILAALERRYSGGRTMMQQIADEMDPGAADTGDEDVDRLKDQASEAPVVRLVNHLIEEAVRRRASDIHIEPFPDSLAVRLRVDGVLQDLPPPPVRLAKAVVSRIKILAHLNIAERRLPQDGRVAYVILGQQIDLRVSTLPTVHGESVVLRLLDRSAGARPLASLGLGEEEELRLRRLLEVPNGMILVTGPTGSGKTTTLYAALNLIDAASRKVLTIEDPVEYHIPRVNQVQVKPQIGLTFASVLRSLVRQDPDVIMVGEMRDAETADIAVHAALTGHLVLSTLHTNSAAGAVTRLLDMGIEPFLLVSTVRAIVGQRLVRTLCRRCRRAQPASAESQEVFRAARLETPLQGLSLFRPGGCEHCGGAGYHGRIGLFEVLTLDAGLRELTLARAGADAIEAAARQSGMTTMYEDGLHKVLDGLTTLEEVRRVTDIW